MFARLTVIEAASAPTKIRGASNVPSGFSCKLLYVRDDDKK